MDNKNMLRILLADDDSTDRELFIDAVSTTGISPSISQAENGMEVLQLLNGGEILPDLIFLDLNMPIMDGRETLLAIRSSEKLKAIPTFILSTSSSTHDVENSYRSGANLFFVKPDDFNVLAKTLKDILLLIQTSVAIPKNP